jgi:hypothetical protein
MFFFRIIFYSSFLSFSYFYLGEGESVESRVSNQKDKVRFTRLRNFKVLLNCKKKESARLDTISDLKDNLAQNLKLSYKQRK